MNNLLSREHTKNHLLSLLLFRIITYMYTQTDKQYVYPRTDYTKRFGLSPKLNTDLQIGCKSPVVKLIDRAGCGLGYRVRRRIDRLTANPLRDWVHDVK
ncbi:hypothetical protein AVEN_205039-1 [Araneus ventricosus]|uniref:Uncharacterized protein n=1 Tax=Araneus ventricosus TaxID=182803 RepID=A0A4Y2RVM3_ARAVE|nr:hypothetical protein AVEN_205039-1 [Araneus ventricosus]